MARQVFGVIAPHPPIMVREVGGVRADVTEASLVAMSDASAALAHFDPETIVLISPHAPGLFDAFVVDDSATLTGSLADFGDPTPRQWTGDPTLAARIVSEAQDRGLPVVTRSEEGRLRPGWLDHATIVPLSFLDAAQGRRLVVLSLSGLPYASHRELGAAVASAVESLDHRVAFVASGDLSHRLKPGAPAGYAPRAHELDAAIVGLVEQGRLEGLSQIDPDLIDAGGECGLRSIIALGGYCCEDPAPARVLAYEGPWGVGYLTALVGRAALFNSDTRPGAQTAEKGAKSGMPGSEESEIVALARAVIDRWVRHGLLIESPTLAGEEFPQRAGVFVSLHRKGELRGCIGTIAATRATLAEEVAHNAVEASTRDPRFPPVNPDELDDLDIKVDVLNAAEACHLDDLDPATYGVIATSGWKRGLLLPALDGVDDVETQVRIVLQKAGIRPGEPCSFERFKVDRYT